MIRIYTDGACQNNGTKDAKASWAYIVVNDQGRVIHSDAKRVVGKQSNNTGELFGVYEAMKYAEANGHQACIIYSDSKYSINSITKWNIEKRVGGQKKANYDLIKEIMMFRASAKCDFELAWVKGHGDSTFNNMADQAAVNALYFNS